MTRPRVSVKLKEMRKSGSVRKKVAGAAGVTSWFSVAANPSPKERGKLVPSRKNTATLRSLPPGFRGAQSDPEGMRKTGSAEKDCDSRRTSPPGRR